MNERFSSGRYMISSARPAPAAVGQGEAKDHDGLLYCTACLVLGCVFWCVVGFCIWYDTLESRAEKYGLSSWTEARGLKERCYFVEGACSNCGQRFDVAIPKGVKVQDAVYSRVCGTCGVFNQSGE